MHAPLDRPPFTLAGCWQGARYTLPLWPSIIVFANAFGAAAVQKGLTLEQAMGLSAFVFAGASQMVALEVWQATWTPATVLAVTTVTAVINARMILMGAAIQPWLAREPLGRNALNLFLLTDANWLIGTRYNAEGGRDVGVLFGAGATLWVIWVAATLPGYLLGSLVPEPKRFGLDLVLPIFFAAMLIPLWKGWRPARPWAVAGLVALAVHALVPGYAFIVAGALAGALAGAILG
ncbi:MAG TPA: AzlC family ABC transporter permease [Microvirga sp.]|jgi:predicted branched-subunit amino acid permease